MALKKKIIDERGIVTHYHKIKFFVVDCANMLVRVSVSNYTNDAYRAQEKQNKALTDNFKKKYEDLNNLIDDNVDGEKTVEIIRLSEEINSIVEVKDNEPLLSVSEFTELLEYDPDGDYSLSGIYTKLKMLDRYSGSKDI